LRTRKYCVLYALSSVRVVAGANMLVMAVWTYRSWC